jgi:hypothetical protein
MRHGFYFSENGLLITRSKIQMLNFHFLILNACPNTKQAGSMPYQPPPLIGITAAKAAPDDT